MAKLMAAERNALPASAFVFPKERAFPIHDRAHAYAALRLAGRESPDRQAKVREAVCQRWRIGCSGASPVMDAEDLKDHGVDESREHQG